MYDENEIETMLDAIAEHERFVDDAANEDIDKYTIEEITTIVTDYRRAKVDRDDLCATLGLSSIEWMDRKKQTVEMRWPGRYEHVHVGRLWELQQEHQESSESADDDDWRVDAALCWRREQEASVRAWPH